MDFLFEEGNYLSFLSGRRQAMVPKRSAGDCIYFLWQYENDEPYPDINEAIKASALPEGFKYYLLAKGSADDKQYRELICYSAEVGYPISQFILASLLIFESKGSTSEVGRLFESAAASGHIKSRFFQSERMLQSDDLNQRKKAKEWIAQCEMLGLDDALRSANKLESSQVNIFYE